MWANQGVESESHASRIVSAIKIYDTLERSVLKIHRKAFASCSRAKGCDFCGLLTFCSETFLEKLSPLNALRNYGDRWGKLRRVRKHESHRQLQNRLDFKTTWQRNDGLWGREQKRKCREISPICQVWRCICLPDGDDIHLFWKILGLFVLRLKIVVEWRK